MRIERQASAWVVHCYWGRCHKKQQRKPYLFDSPVEIIRFTDAILRKRHRNGYKLIRVSKFFPLSPALPTFPQAIGESVQLQLF